MYLLGCLLGWVDIGLGLQRLYEGKRPPVESAELDLLEAIWNDRDQLKLFALWAWTHNEPIRTETFSEAAPPRSPERFMGPVWYESFLNGHTGHGVACVHDPYDPTAGNPLHLGHALGALAHTSDEGGVILHSELSQRRAIALLEQSRGWLDSLDRLAETLPLLPQRSWRIDVVVRPCGWLGTFRRSRVTGRWFTGKHSVHVMGFPSDENAAGS